jgi:alpha-galactosidase
MPRRPTPSLFLLFCLLVSFNRSVSAARIASTGDAAISRDSAAGTWTLEAAGAVLTLTLDAARDFAITDFRSPSGAAWSVNAAPDTFVRVGGQTLPFGNRASGFALQNVTTATDGDRLQLNATFTLASAGLRLTRHYAVVSGSPTFEVWTSYAPTSDSRPIADLNALVMTVPAGTTHWVEGLQGEDAGASLDSAFKVQQKALASGEHLTLGSQGRSSERTVPWFAVASEQDVFYTALMWSGAWALGVERTASGLALSMGLAPMTTTIGGPVDGPRAIFGVARGGLPDATAALRSYVLAGVRRGRPLSPLVTYNTWFAYGTEIDDTSMREEMRHAAAIGVELFVLDAGWYPGTGIEGPSDFDAGLGSWVVDASKFPEGLRPLTEYAHALGMKFGLWVEPERTNLSVVGESGPEESWLATHHGEYESDHAAQICLAGSAARQWVIDRLTAMLDEVQPDYLKWDNNMWVNCDRAGHGHGSTDGNFAHVTALYGVLDEVRQRYPDMLVENVSGGGNRLDLAMMRYSDVGWMDDRTAPSVHVRHNIQGLSVVFPPAYLLSFVTNYETEPLHESPDLSLYLRSRMTSVLGLCFRATELTEGDTNAVMHEIDVYKIMRDTLLGAAAALLSQQALAENGPAWDVLQETAQGSQQVLISAFQTDMSVDKITIKPVGLVPYMEYLVQSVDTGALGSAMGSDLMADGIDVYQSPNTASHILFLTARE